MPLATATSTPQPGVTVTTPHCPSPAQFALALIVLKSKPVDLSLEDYFDHLRKHIRNGTHEDPELEHQHVDGAAFWKQAHERSEAEKAKLKDEIFQLKHPQVAVGNGEMVFQVSDMPITGKRKRGSRSLTKANSQSKRRAASLKHSQPTDTGLADAASTTDSAKLKASPSFMRRFFDLRQAISFNTPDTCALSIYLQQLCRDASVLLEESTTKATPQITSDVTVAVQRSFPTILQGLDKLEQPALSDELGIAVYEIVVLFETVLSQLSTVVMHEAEGYTNDHVSKAKLTRSKSRTTINIAAQTSNKYHNACQSLVELAVCMIVTLKPSMNSHVQVLEGCLSAFLDHLGSSLSLAVFSDDQLPQLQSTFMGVMPPQGLQDTSGADPESTRRTIRIEAPYLISILGRVMTFVENHQIFTSARFASLFLLHKDRLDGNSTLAQTVREKLQNTLLRGIFGEDDEMFRNSLRRPAQPENQGMVNEDIQIGAREGTSEWFTSEVWRILGWNVLTVDALF